ncbi:MAG: hypothetical protein HKN07_07555 [Acidimicrobiia bacterium]|nr:hypothetical protein [Acidimicrobiia bacterium]
METFDCELIRSAFPAQPINTLSSLAFIIAAAYLWRRRHRLFGTVIGLTGVGSILFHGNPSSLSSALHDGALVAAILGSGVLALRRIRLGAVPIASILVGAIGIVVWSTTRTGGSWCDPDALIQGHAVWHVMAAFAVGALAAKPTHESS